MENYKIIADSCADLSDDMKTELDVQETIPFYLHIAEETLVDDHTLSIPVLLQKMKECTVKMTTSCSDPQTWKNAFEKAKKAFAVTISRKLSGSFSSACAGLEMAVEESGCEGYIFDSMSAASGQTLLVYKIRDFINQGLSFTEIVEKIEKFILKMRTFFVLDDVSNLVKNGRMSNITGTIVQILGIKPILGDKRGEIELFGKVRGYNNIADKMVSMITASGRVIDGDDFIVSHCNNLSLAQEILNKAKEQFNFGKMRIIEMRGLSSFYACDKGVCMSF